MLISAIVLIGSGYRSSPPWPPAGPRCLCPCAASECAASVSPPALSAVAVGRGGLHPVPVPQVRPCTQPSTHCSATSPAPPGSAGLHGAVESFGSWRCSRHGGWLRAAPTPWPHCWLGPTEPMALPCGNGCPAPPGTSVGISGAQPALAQLGSGRCSLALLWHHLGTTWHSPAVGCGTGRALAPVWHQFGTTLYLSTPQSGSMAPWVWPTWRGCGRRGRGRRGRGRDGWAWFGRG